MVDATILDCDTLDSIHISPTSWDEIGLAEQYILSKKTLIL